MQLLIIPIVDNDEATIELLAQLHHIIRLFPTPIVALLALVILRKGHITIEIGKV